MEYGLIGEHLGHSFSKEIHGKIGDYSYELKEIAPADLEAFIKGRGFKGINVTIPYKQDVIPMLDYVDPPALEIGAVNTIVNRDGKLRGYNTDFLGMKSMIEAMGIEVAGKKVLILGTGGTSRTATAVANSLGAKEILHVSRSKKDGKITYEEAYANHTDAGIIINTTPCGMFPNVNGMPIKLDAFTNLSGVVDAIYNPICSELVLAAKSRNIKATGGLYMLVSQAIKAAEFFFDTSYESELTERIFKGMEAAKGNIVLVGMPGCGKSTVGRILANHLNRALIDTDELIVEKAGMEITDIFAKYGEVYFRDLESQVIAELSTKTGIIISTGGGAVLREQNVKELKRNGKLYLLDRDLEKIKPTADRPLADNHDKLVKLYHERKPIYKACCDVVIEVTEGADTVANKLLTASGLE